jgi:hypothetical protein
MSSTAQGGMNSTPGGPMRQQDKGVRVVSRSLELGDPSEQTSGDTLMRQVENLKTECGRTDISRLFW